MPLRYFPKAAWLEIQYNPKCTYNCYNYLIIASILLVQILGGGGSTYSTLDLLLALITARDVEMSFVREGNSTAATIYSPGTGVRYLLKGLEPLERLWTFWKIEVNISGVTLTHWIFERSMNIYKGKVLLVETRRSFREPIGSERKKNISHSFQTGAASE